MCTLDLVENSSLSTTVFALSVLHPIGGWTLRLVHATPMQFNVCLVLSTLTANLDNGTKLQISVTWWLGQSKWLIQFFWSSSKQFRRRFIPTTQSWMDFKQRPGKFVCLSKTLLSLLQILYFFMSSRQHPVSSVFTGMTPVRTLLFVLTWNRRWTLTLL